MASVFKKPGRPNWIAAWYNHDYSHRIERSTRTTDKRLAERLATEWEGRDLSIRGGLADAGSAMIADQARLPFSAHLDAFEAKMRAENRDPRHTAITISAIRAFAAARNVGAITGITAGAANTYSDALFGLKRSARTVHAHLTALKSFTSWLVVMGKLPTDPLACIKKPDPKSGQTLFRRMLLPVEWVWLRSTTESGPDRFGMTAGERVTLYATALQTGLRQNELRSLTRGQCYLEQAKPFIRIRARSTKNRKDAHQYITAHLADTLRAHLATKAPAAPVFAMPDPRRVPGMLRADLTAARDAWIKEAEHDASEQARRRESDFLVAINHDGEQLDFHALRHTCGAWAASGGAHPKAVQTLMRHSTITLTMDTYGHLFPGQDAETVHRMPDMGMGPEPIRATGTVGPHDDRQRHRQRATHGQGRTDAEWCCEAQEDASAVTARNPLPIAEKRGNARGNAGMGAAGFEPAKALAIRFTV